MENYEKFQEALNVDLRKLEIHQLYFQKKAISKFAPHWDETMSFIAAICSAPMIFIGGFKLLTYIEISSKFWWIASICMLCSVLLHIRLFFYRKKLKNNYWTPIEGFRKKIDDEIKRRDRIVLDQK